MPPKSGDGRRGADQGDWPASLSTVTASLSTVTPRFKVYLKSPGASGSQNNEPKWSAKLLGGRKGVIFKSWSYF